MEPEGRSPCTHGSVKEDVGTCLAHGTFYADDSFSILNAGVTLIRSESCTLCADAVKLEEAEIVIANHVVAAVNEVVVICLIAQLHTATVFPILATISAATAVTAYRT